MFGANVLSQSNIGFTHDTSKLRIMDLLKPLFDNCVECRYTKKKR